MLKLNKIWRWVASGQFALSEELKNAVIIKKSQLSHNRTAALAKGKRC
ncbi:hypothetical protein AAUPMC_01447 [Pasteurella multocida subsp. multocida str. Anand1_cattle]|nr:hypothetical protein AAUPMC_01447 [Pasteurella multocida subsp. multocida str. Anand1_cattle]